MKTEKIFTFRIPVELLDAGHALGLAVPLVVAISTSVAAQKGLLIRNRTAFENARLITTILFDKTGTLTKGSHELNEVKSLSVEYDDRELLLPGYLLNAMPPRKEICYERYFDFRRHF